MANEQQLMTMQKWIDVTDDLLKFRKKNLLTHSGTISHKQAYIKTMLENKSIDEFNDRILNLKNTSGAKFFDNTLQIIQ